MRRTWLSWLLPILMLLAQQGAYLHELSHYQPASEQGHGGDRKHAADKVCDTCLAYSHVADVASFSSFHAPLLALGHILIGAVTWSARPGAAPCARSRGPPTFL